MPIIGGRQIGVRGLGFQGAGKPSAPTIDSVSAPSTSSVTVNYTLGASNGAPITAITILSSPSTSLSYASGDLDGSVTVTGTFTANQSYTFTMTSTNAVGTSDSSAASNSIKPSPSYFISSFRGQSTRSDGISSTYTDSSNNIYTVGTSIFETADKWSTVAMKLDSRSNILWQKKLSAPSTTSTFGRKSSLDVDGNLYVAYAEGSFGNNCRVTKYNSSGVVQWQKRYTGMGNISGIYCDSINGIFVYGSANESPGIIKIDSSGAIIWQKNVYRSAFSGSTINDIKVSPSTGDIYCVASISVESYNVLGLYVIKFNSSGVLQWGRRMYDTLNYITTYGNGICLDSSDNVYAIGFTDNSNTGRRDAEIISYSSVGNYRWNATYSATGAVIPMYQATIDSSNNIYVVGYSRASGATQDSFQIFKIGPDYAGQTIWQKTLTCTGSSMNGGAQPFINSSGNLVAGGSIAFAAATTTTDSILATLPPDGNFDGSYVLETQAGNKTIVAASSSYGVFSGGKTRNAITLTSDTSTVTVSDITNTDAVSDLTMARVYI
jgi:hypothetical protein